MACCRKVVRSLFTAENIRCFRRLMAFARQVRARGVFDTAQGVLRKAYEDGKKSVGDGRLGFMSEVKEELRVSV